MSFDSTGVPNDNSGPLVLRGDQTCHLPQQLLTTGTSPKSLPAMMIAFFSAADISATSAFPLWLQIGRSRSRPCPPDVAQRARRRPSTTRSVPSGRQRRRAREVGSPVRRRRCPSWASRSPVCPVVAVRARPAAEKIPGAVIRPRTARVVATAGSRGLARRGLEEGVSAK